MGSKLCAAEECDSSFGESSSTISHNSQSESDSLDFKYSTTDNMEFTFSRTEETVNLGNFDILRVIGRGSFGQVCEVRKKDSDEFFAIKCANKRICAERRTYRNVINEMDILSSIHHSSVVSLQYAFQDSRYLYMVFDHYSGGDLRSFIKISKFIPEDQVMFHALDIAQGLEYLRTERIVHRDIKPENLLLDNLGHIHIADFSIALRLQNGVANTFSGTLPYMAPEVYLCLRNPQNVYSYEVDWWSMGICIHEMICGERPYSIHTTSRLDDIFMMLHAEPPGLPDSISKSMKSLVKYLLQKQPKNRLSHADDLKKYCNISNMC